MHKRILYYEHSFPPTCFGHSCGNPQQGALKGFIYRDVTKVCEPVPTWEINQIKCKLFYNFAVHKIGPMCMKHKRTLVSIKTHQHLLKCYNVKYNII